MSLERNSLADIWNSDEMRSVRRAMVNGQEVPGCHQCYADEAKGVVSMRTRDNVAFEAGFLNAAKQTINQLKSLAVRHDFRLPALPLSLEVAIGSLCNLKCRMGHDGVSSRIASDPVHSSWASDRIPVARITMKALQRAMLGQAYSPQLTSAGNRFQRKPPPNKAPVFHWGRAAYGRGVGEVLKRLIETGDDKATELAIVSNGSITGSWLSLTKTFRRTDVSISIDGFDEHYDYIRYPAKWLNLARNLAAFKAMALSAEG